MTEREKLANTLQKVAANYDATETAWLAAPTSAETYDEFAKARGWLAVVCRVHLPTLLTALRADSDAAVERAAEVLFQLEYAEDECAEGWADMGESVREPYRDTARAALRAALEPQP